MDKDIGWAIDQLRKGETVARADWVRQRHAAYIRLHTPADGEKLNAPFVYFCDEWAALTPYTPSQADLLATDWQHYNLSARAERALAQETRSVSRLMAEETRQ